jgi:hypothetical protein
MSAMRSSTSRSFRVGAAFSFRGFTAASAASSSRRSVATSPAV